MTVVRHFTLLVILLAAAVGTAIAQSTPKQGTATEKSSLKSDRAKQPDQSHETVEKVLPTADKPSANLTDTHVANSSEDIETQRKLVEFTKWLAIVGGLQFLALIVQAIVFWRTLHQVKAQANLMRVHAGHLENLVVAGKANAEAARNNAIATKDSASALINSERAWVMAEIEGDRGKWADGKVHIVEGSGTSGDSTGTWIILSCKNEGNSPGWIYEKRSIFEVVSSLNPVPDFDSLPIIFEGREPIGTGKGIPHTTNLHQLAIAQGHANSKDVMVIYGIVKYQDIFKQSRTTTFGYRITTGAEGYTLERLREYAAYNENT